MYRLFGLKHHKVEKSLDVTIVTHGWTDGDMEFEVGLDDKDLWQMQRQAQT